MLKGSATFKFDSEEIDKYMTPQKSKMLRRIGGFLRKVAQRSMRKRKGPSPAGSPPHAHDSPLLRTFLEYAFDPIKLRVVVGPKLIPRSTNLILPGLMERGGVVQARNKKTTFSKLYPARPYMRPALEKQAKSLLFNSMKGEL